MMIETIAIWPSMGCAGIVDAEAGVRSGAPVGGDSGRTSMRTDALSSFPRASSTCTVARFMPTNEYAWRAKGDDCSRGWLPSPKSNSYARIRFQDDEERCEELDVARSNRGSLRLHGKRCLDRPLHGILLSNHASGTGVLFEKT